MTTISLNQALDQAVEKLRPLHKRVLKMRLNYNKSYRSKLLDELALRLHDDAECCALQQSASVASTVSLQDLLAEGNPDTIYSFDPDTLAKFLELIIKYLPQLISILLPIFTSLLIPFLLLIPSTASAQCVNCRQPTLAPALAPAFRPTVSILQVQPIQPVRQAVRAVVQPVVRTVTQPVIIAQPVQQIILQPARRVFFRPFRLSY